MSNISRYGKYHPKFKGRIDSKLLEFSSSLKRLNLPCNVPAATHYDIQDAKIVPDTHPGIITRKLFQAHYKKKMSITKANIAHVMISSLIKN